MNQLKSIYNSPFKDLQSHPIHTCFPMIASNEGHASFRFPLEEEIMLTTYGTFMSICCIKLKMVQNHMNLSKSATSGFTMIGLLWRNLGSCDSGTIRCFASCRSFCSVSSCLKPWLCCSDICWSNSWFLTGLITAML